MIDLHFHALPGIDDGPVDLAEALALCRAAAADGTETIVATPHVLRDPWLNEDRAVRRALLEQLNAALGGKPRVLAGCEFWWGEDVLDLLEKGEDGPIDTLASSRYLLVEFPPGFVPAGVGDLFHEMRVTGRVPLIAHPERNLVFARAPEALAALVENGAAVQVTAGSLLGEFGRGARAAAEEYLDLGLVHVIASDAHDPRRRPPRMAAARESVRKHLGPEVEAGLFEANPAAILADLPLPFGWRG